jgi:predicted transcriptional regulator of viral defense system
MKLYFELLKHPVFTMKHVKQYYDNIESARSAVKRLIKSGLVVKIRNNLYTCISGETDAPLANRYQIAGAITPTSYLSHHSEMEYYGISDQIFYEVYVSSKCNEGIETVKYSGGVRIADRERAVIDSIKDLDKIAGLEEVIDNIQAVSVLREKRMLAYLECYDNQFLYQKTGFLLKSQQERIGLSNEFFQICKNRIGHSKRYLTKDYKEGKYDTVWRLVVPEQMNYLKNEGVRHEL